MSLIRNVPRAGGGTVRVRLNSGRTPRIMSRSRIHLRLAQPNPTAPPRRQPSAPSGRFGRRCEKKVIVHMPNDQAKEGGEVKYQQSIVCSIFYAVAVSCWLTGNPSFSTVSVEALLKPIMWFVFYTSYLYGDLILPVEPEKYESHLTWDIIIWTFFSLQGILSSHLTGTIFGVLGLVLSCVSMLCAGDTKSIRGIVWSFENLIFAGFALYLDGLLEVEFGEIKNITLYLCVIDVLKPSFILLLIVLIAIVKIFSDKWLTKKESI